MQNFVYILDLIIYYKKYFKVFTIYIFLKNSFYIYFLYKCSLKIIIKKKI